MSIFGGGFATGLVTGFAESANRALKEDIERINTRIDKVADLKFKRALKDQEERKAEFDEVDDLLRQAGALFEDDPFAADYAAGLLKKSGNITAFKQTIADLTSAKKNNVPLAQFVRRASVDSPSGTYKDFANAYVDSRRTLPDSSIPEDTSRAGGLISSVLGKPIDISGRAETKVSEQMQAAGIVPREEAELTAPAIEFDREGMSMYQMSPSERVNYIREELARPSADEKRVAELQGMLTTNLEKAKETGDNETRLSALKTQLGYADTDEERNAIKANIKNVTRQIQIDGALDEKSRILIQSEHALEDGNPDLARKLKRQAEDMVSGPTLDVILARKKEDLDTQVGLFYRTNGEQGIDPESEEGKQLIAGIDAMQFSLDQYTGANKLDNADRTAAVNLVEKSFSNSLASMVNERPDLFTTDEFDKPVFKPGLQDDLKAEAIAIEKRVRTEAINNAISFTDSKKEKIALQVYKEELLRLRMINPDGSEEEQQPATPTKPEDADVATPFTVGNYTIPQSTIDSMASANNINRTAVEGVIKRVIDNFNPNDITTAAEFANKVAPEKFDLQLSQLEQIGVYSQEWIQAAKDAKKTKDDVALAERQKRSDELSKTTAVKLAKQLRNAKTLDEYNIILEAYLAKTGRTKEDVAKTMPPPSEEPQKKNKGGLMAR